MKLFEPFVLGGLTIPNRVAVSPMCQYSSVDGFPSDWHLVNLGSRAVGGAGLVITEAAGVTADGRITPDDAGIYLDEHIAAWAPIAKFISDQGSVPGIQLAHAGRKASTSSPWKGGKGLSVEEGGWSPVWSASSLPFNNTYIEPQRLTMLEIPGVVAAFKRAAERALEAGFKVAEIHAAHGYLLHQFMSPLSNDRADEYGGGFENRVRIVLEVAEAVRSVWPKDLGFIVRISGTDWTEGGWDIEQSIELSKLLKEIGVDAIDVSSGGNVPRAPIPVGPGYQVPLAEQIRREAEIAVGGSWHDYGAKAGKRHCRKR